jgi:acyl-ACP thioesterase
MTFIDEFVPVPTVGRTYLSKRYVRLGDVNPHGRMRLDALARAVQDIATADAADALTGVLSESLSLTTFCGGTGRSWAERRTSILGDQGARIETAAIWVPIDAQGRPSRLPEDFLAAYGEAAGGRRVDARRHHSDLPAGDSVHPGVRASVQPWPIRYADLDTLGHVNNAAHWCAMEDRLVGKQVQAAEIEFVGGLMLEEPCSFVTVERNDGVDGWLCAEGHVRSSQRVWITH